MLLSIILPCYNSEKHVKKCIDSILTSSFQDFELIIVNDGSTDNTKSIIEAFSSESVHIIHTENHGVSSARNTGIANAHGKYVTFIDSDDFISTQFLEELVSPTLSSEGTDFVQGGFTNYYDNGRTTTGQSYEQYAGNDMIFLYPRFRGLVFSKLFKTEIIRNEGIQFLEALNTGEDMLFTLQYIVHIKDYAFSSTTGYMYRRDNEQSLTHINQKRSYKLLHQQFAKEHEAVSLFINKHKLPPPAHKMRTERLCDLMTFAISNMYRQEKDRKTRIEFLKSNYNEEALRLLEHTKGKRQRILFYGLLRNRMYLTFDTIMHLLING